MCLTEGIDGVKAASIFESIEEKFNKDGLTWESCVSLSVNSTSAIAGKCNSIASWFVQKNSEIIICGCPSHFAKICLGLPFATDRLGILWGKSDFCGKID